MYKKEYGDTGDPGTNGSASRPAPEDRRTKLGFVAGANTAADRRGTNERIRDLDERVKHFSQGCEDTRALITAAEEHRDGLAFHERGWPIPLVAVLALVTIVLEWVPASLFTQVFTTASDSARLLLALTFTTIGVVVAVVLGELLRRSRAPVRGAFIEMAFLVIVAAITVTFLCIGYQIRVAYTTATGGTFMALAAWLEALALTAIAAIGIILTVVSTYYKESLEMFQVKWALKRLNGDLRTNESHLRTNQRDLERARASIRADDPSSPERSRTAYTTTRVDTAPLKQAHEPAKDEDSAKT